jgi:phosphate transport system substrate-binding protein
MGKRRNGLLVLAMIAVLALVAAACGDDDGGGETGSTTGATGETAEVTGSLNISGSSTVEPITSLVAEQFQGLNPGVTVAVDGPGTSDGFELFCNGETDISDASRQIEQEEVDACSANGIEPIELEIGLDALTVIGHTGNPVNCMNSGDLYALFGPESEGIDTWNGADSLAKKVGGSDGFPDQSLTIVAPGEESGTYDSFIELSGIEDIALEQGVPEDEAATLRPDYQISADDNVIVDNASGTEGGLGFVGFAFATNAGDSVKLFEVDGGDGCVAPGEDTVIDGTYPLARSLYIYVNPNKITENPALAPFVDYYLSDEGIASVTAVQYVALPTDRLEAARSAWESASASA